MQSTAKPIAIIMSNFWPEPTGGSATATEFAIFLRHKGLAVNVVTSMPFYPQWRIWPEYRGKVWHTEVHEGVRILRSWHFVMPRVTTLVRIMHEVTLTLFALPSLVRVIWGADQVFLFSPALGFAFVGGVIAKVLRKRQVVVVKDVMPEAAIELGMMTNRFMIRTARFMARFLYRNAAEIHTLGKGMEYRIAVECSDPTKIRIVPDTVDGEELHPVPYEENEFRRRFVPEGVFAVLHTGNMGKKQDVDLILRAADLLRDDGNIRFFVFGDGVERERFLLRRAELRLEDTVAYHPLQERWLLKHMLSGADVVLVSQLKEVVDIVVPSKLLTSMASGAMVVAACPDGSEPRHIIDESQGGIRIPAEDERAFADVIGRVRSGEVNTSRCRSNARVYALGTFGREAIYGPIATEILHSGRYRTYGGAMPFRLSSSKHHRKKL